MNVRKAVPAQIGSMEFLVDSSVGPDQTGISENKSGIRETSPPLPPLPANARANLIAVVDQLRTEFHNRWEEVFGSVPGPAEMSLEVAFAFESGINAWVIVGKGTAGIKVAFKWTRTN